MRILINTNGVSVGGGLQLADSIIREMVKVDSNYYLIVHHGQLSQTISAMNGYYNVECYYYALPKFTFGTITGRNISLDNLVKTKRIDVVFTIMGMSKWKPRVPHLEGFARCKTVIPESPYWKEYSRLKLIKLDIINKVINYCFRISSDAFWTESDFISDRVRQFLPKKAKVFTVSGYYNQVYDMPELWDNSINFPAFDGITLLTIAANYPHKNLKIISPLVHYMEEKHPEIKFRVVLTVKEDELKGLDDAVRSHVLFLGGVKITQCPHMYEQCDIMFMPSLLECFSATYAEAMRMNKPILVPNLGFASILCKDAAQYYDAVNVESLGEALYELCTNAELRNRLVAKGQMQLREFNNYEQRAKKLLDILQTLNNEWKQSVQ